MRLALRMALAGWLVATSAACASVQAKTPAEMPLQTPAPPPRVVIPVVVENPPAEPAPPAATPAPPAIVAPHPNAVAPPPSSTTASSTPPPVRPADKPAAPPEAPPPTATARELRDKTSTLLKTANEDLGKVVYASLNEDLKAQYNQAKRFIAIAQDALNKRSYDYAHDMAEKAANLVSQLPKARRSNLS